MPLTVAVVQAARRRRQRQRKPTDQREAADQPIEVRASRSAAEHRTPLVYELMYERSVEAYERSSTIEEFQQDIHEVMEATIKKELKAIKRLKRGEREMKAALEMLERGEREMIAALEREKAANGRLLMRIEAEEARAEVAEARAEAAETAAAALAAELRSDETLLRRAKHDADIAESRRLEYREDVEDWEAEMTTHQTILLAELRSTEAETEKLNDELTDEVAELTRKWEYVVGNLEEKEEEIDDAKVAQAVLVGELRSDETRVRRAEHDAATWESGCLEYEEEVEEREAGMKTHQTILLAELRSTEERLFEVDGVLDQLMMRLPSDLREKLVEDAYEDAERAEKLADDLCADPSAAKAGPSSAHSWGRGVRLGTNA